jgi:hypothetical protein
LAISTHLVLQGDLDLRGRRRLRPPEQLQRVVVVGVVEGHAVVDQQLAGELEGLRRDHLPQRLGQLVGRHVGVHPLVLVGDDDVDGVGVVADVLVDPLALDLELLGREPDGTEHAEATGLAHGDDDVAAMREGEDRELDAEVVADGRAHGSRLERVLVCDQHWRSSASPSRRPAATRRRCRRSDRERRRP